MLKFMKFICSIPIILITSYFIPFLGVCLIITRYFVYKNKKNYELPIVFIVVGFLLLLPKLYMNLMPTFNLPNIDFISDFTSSDVYKHLISYSKFSICVGVIFLIISFIVKSVMQKLEKNLKSYIGNVEKRNTEIAQQNDLIIKEKREKAQNTTIVHCKNCGADNILTSKVGNCKYCRKPLSGD